MICYARTDRQTLLPLRLARALEPVLHKSGPYGSSERLPAPTGQATADPVKGAAPEDASVDWSAAPKLGPVLSSPGTHVRLHSPPCFRCPTGRPLALPYGAPLRSRRAKRGVLFSGGAVPGSRHASGQGEVNSGCCDASPTRHGGEMWYEARHFGAGRAA